MAAALTAIFVGEAQFIMWMLVLPAPWGAVVGFVCLLGVCAANIWQFKHDLERHHQPQGD